MHRAGGGLGENSRVRFEAVHGKHLAVIRAGVFGEETGPVYTHTFSVGAPNQLACQAILTVAAINIRIDRDALTRPESCDVGADVVDLTDGFVPWSERIYADVCPVVQMHVGATDAGLVDLDPYVQWTDLRHRQIGDCEGAGGFV